MFSLKTWQVGPEPMTEDLIKNYPINLICVFSIKQEKMKHKIQGVYNIWFNQPNKE